jgi:DNA mismatch repair protein MutL
MSFSIQSLPLDVVNLIAAGEVIDSLTAVVRELVENALDAGANRINISLWPDLWKIQVVDNGRGMNHKDLELCAKPHSTSKIRVIEDLFKIKSLGFRGEALHSISQVADLEILSRLPQSEAMGWRFVYQQGEVIKQEPKAIAPGTIVIVSNLFAQMPVRRRSLSSTAQQLKMIQTTIQHMALTHPQVTWQIWQNEKLWLKFSPSKNTLSLLSQIIRGVNITDLKFLHYKIVPKIAKENANFNPDQTVTNLIENESEIEQGDIKVVVGLPDRCHRHKPDWIKVGINGRIVKSPPLESAIFASFARTLPRDRYPVCFIHLNIPAHQIDWNRHPAKAEVYLHNIEFWQTEIKKAIDNTLKISPANLPKLENQRVTNLLIAAESQGLYTVSRELEKKIDQNIRENNLSLIPLTVVAQVRNTYIIAEHSHGLWIIEQHIAHERVLYEQLQDYWELIPLKTPIILQNLTYKQVEQLQRIGLEIENFGEQMWALRNIPAMLENRDDCSDAIMELSWGGDLQESQVAVACRSAIRNGTPLSLSRMQSLIDQWKLTRNPRTCPHGRPIYLSLEESSLARFFRRSWVKGKSHGI